MPSIVERAVWGHGRSMTELYEAHKDELYAFCGLLVNKDKAADIAAEVLCGSFALAAEQGVTTEEDYVRLLMVEAAKRCGALTLDGNAPQAENTAPKAKFVRAGAVFNGSVKDGLARLEETMAKLSDYQRFAFLLATAGGLGLADIAAAMKQREAIARYCLETAAYIMSRMPADTVRTDQMASLFKKAAADAELPAAADAVCRRHVAANSKRQTPLWKLLVPVAAVAVVIVLALVIFLPGGKLSYTSGGNGEGAATTTTANTEGLIHGTTTLDLTKTYYADIDIKDHGVITVKLEPGSAPITVENFVTLAQDGFYDGLTFHRIIEDFMMQGGDPEGDGTGGADQDIVGEFTSNGYDNTLTHTRGAISMARSDDPDSASSQFFIVHETSEHLDGDYAVFGYVTEGMDIVDTICEEAEPIDSNGFIAASRQPVINTVTIRVE